MANIHCNKGLIKEHKDLPFLNLGIVPVNLAEKYWLKFQVDTGADRSLVHSSVLQNNLICKANSNQVIYFKTAGGGRLPAFPLYVLIDFPLLELAGEKNIFTLYVSDKITPGKCLAGRDLLSHFNIGMYFDSQHIGFFDCECVDKSL